MTLQEGKFHLLKFSRSWTYGIWWTLPKFLVFIVFSIRKVSVILSLFMIVFAWHAIAYTMMICTKKLMRTLSE